MIIDTLDRIGAYCGISQNLDKAIESILAGEYTSKADGEYIVHHDAVRYIIQSPVYTMQGTWEKHRRNIDIQISVTGDELCRWFPVDELSAWGEYDSLRDIAFTNDETHGLPVHLQKGWFIILFPQDAHMPNIPVADAKQGRKVVYKVGV